MTHNAVIIGDFNLDYAKVYDDNYAHKHMFAEYSLLMSQHFHTPGDRSSI